MPFRYPIALELQGRRCVVIGGGDVAERKAQGLLEAGADVAVISPTFTEGLEALAHRGDVHLVPRSYAPGDLEGAFLAIAATDDGELNAEVFREADERRVLLNAVDDIEHCHFAVPSVVRREDLLLTVSTGGRAPALAKRLRTTLARDYGPEYGELVGLLGDVREQALRERRVDFPTWAERWDRALDQDLVGLVRHGRGGEVKQSVNRVLDGQVRHSPLRPRGRVSLVGAGPGDPGLLTVRGRQVLDEADVVVYDRLVHPSLLDGKDVVYVGKQAGAHAVDQGAINGLLVRMARAGQHVARLKGGDPLVFGRGSEEAQALADARIDFEIVPAPTSALAALAYAGIPVTDRRFSSSVAIVTGHCAGDREVDWRKLATSVDTVVVLMGLASLEEIVGELIAGGRDPHTPAAVVQDGTLPSQRVTATDLAELPMAAAAAGVRSPAVIVVGDVVRLSSRIAWFGKESCSRAASGAGM